MKAKWKDEEMIQKLIDEIKEIKDKRKNDSERINELIKNNEDKEKRINTLEKKCIQLKELLYE